VEIARQSIVEVATLIVETVIVGYSLKGRSTGCIEFIANEKVTDAPFAKKGKRSKEKDTNRP